ncbi:MULTISPECIES: hypothetical protein [Curtobacterium]|uniref:hypothetical protein n=1 Tax=Curtobacterium flaccumfaciens TaxID=2035 RepID=UPI003EE6FD93
MGDYEGIARRAWRRTVWIAIGGFVVGAIVGLFLPSDDDALSRFLSTVGFAVAVGGMSGIGAILPATMKLAPTMQWPIRELDRTSRRIVRRAVFAGKPIEPRDSEMAHRAYDWARGVALSMPLSLAQFLLLYVGLAGLQLPNLLRDDGFLSAFPKIFIGVLLVVAVIVSVAFGRQIRGARRYLAAAAE